MVKKQKILIILALISVTLIFGSWVDPRTVDVYEAEIFIYDNTYGVSNLSGVIQFFLHSYDGIALSDSGYIYNTLGSAITGRALINGNEYSIRIDSYGGLAIQQTYRQNNTDRTTWQTYNMVMDKIPGSLTIDEINSLTMMLLSVGILAFFINKVFTK